MAKKPVKTAEAPGVLEWLMGGLGLVLLLGVLVVLGLEAAASSHPPVLSARLVEVRPVAGGWLAEVEIENRGDETVAAAEVEGALGAETAHATLDYVPAGGKEQVTLGFRADPRAAVFTVRGWSEP